MLGKDLGRASWLALGSTLRPSVAGARNLVAASGSEDEARGKAGTRTGAGNEIVGGALDPVFLISIPFFPLNSCLS